MSKKPVGILLASGHSRRFGSNKLLHPVDGDTGMLFITAKKLCSVLPGCIVVISQELLPYQSQLEQLGASIVINEHAHKGMGSSIACGIQASSEACGWLIALADMPYVKTATLTQLAEALQAGADIVAPSYRQQRGNPVGFNPRYKQQLLSLNQDIGARDIIARHQDKLQLIPTTDASVTTDIDQPSDIIDVQKN